MTLTKAQERTLRATLAAALIAPTPLAQIAAALDRPCPEKARRKKTRRRKIWQKIRS